jgi:hypothetical protein
MSRKIGMPGAGGGDEKASFNQRGESFEVGIEVESPIADLRRAEHQIVMPHHRTHPMEDWIFRHRDTLIP